MTICAVLLSAVSACGAGQAQGRTPDPAESSLQTPADTPSEQAGGSIQVSAPENGSAKSSLQAPDGTALEQANDSTQSPAPENTSAGSTAAEYAASSEPALMAAPADGSDRPAHEDGTKEMADTAKTDDTASTTVAADNTDNDTDIEELLQNMTLQEKIGQMMVASFRVWTGTPKTDKSKKTVENTDTASTGNVLELNDEIRDCIKKYKFGGMLLFAENFNDPEQVLRLVADMQATSLEGGGLPLLVAADQEGGYIVRMSFGTYGVGNMALAATGDPENAKKTASIYGKELGLLGINTDFAPVMDINNNPNNPVIGVRSFSDDPEVVAEYGISFMEGLHEAGTIATLKHFPGHGNTDTDSHTGFPCIQSSYEDLKDFELVPFRKAVDAGADMVMTAHIQYPEIEKETCTSISTGKKVHLPATMSRTILTDILRGDMGFEGVIVSDGLEMAAITDHFSREDILCRTINAGVNMLLLPGIQNMAAFLKTEELTELAVQLAKDGKIDMDCIDDSVRRILSLKKKYGLLDKKDFTVTKEQVTAAVNGIGTDESKKAQWETAQQALTLVKNENAAFPVTLKPDEKALILLADNSASRAGTAELAGELLEEQGQLPEGAKITVMVNTAENKKECEKAAKKADHVILVYRTYSSDCLDPDTEDGFSSAVFDSIIKKRHEKGKQTILVSGQLPYDAARFPEADAILLTYGSSVMRELPPASGKNSGFMPNLPAALCACFGMGEANGQTPVFLPEIDQHYNYITEEETP